MYYTYILKSEKDGNHYAGSTENLKLRLAAHRTGQVKSTANRRPLKLICYEACLCKKDALKREQYFKTHYGRLYLKKRLAGFFNESS